MEYSSDKRKEKLADWKEIFSDKVLDYLFIYRYIFYLIKNVCADSVSMVIFVCKNVFALEFLGFLQMEKKHIILQLVM